MNLLSLQFWLLVLIFSIAFTHTHEQPYPPCGAWECRSRWVICSLCRVVVHRVVHMSALFAGSLFFGWFRRTTLPMSRRNWRFLPFPAAFLSSSSTITTSPSHKTKFTSFRFKNRAELSKPRNKRFIFIHMKFKNRTLKFIKRELLLLTLVMIRFGKRSLGPHQNQSWQGTHHTQRWTSKRDLDLLPSTLLLLVFKIPKVLSFTQTNNIKAYY